MGSWELTEDRPPHDHGAVPCGGSGIDELAGLSRAQLEELGIPEVAPAAGGSIWSGGTIQCAGSTATSQTVYGARRDPEEVVNLVVHTTEGSRQAAINIAKAMPGSGYAGQGWDILTDSTQPGWAMQCNDWTKRISHHAGHWPMNLESIGWETAGFAAQSGQWSNEYYRYMGKVLAQLKKIFPNIPLVRVKSWLQSGVISHRDVYISALGDTTGRWDPGDLKWDLLFRYAKQNAGVIVPERPTLAPKDYNVICEKSEWTGPRADFLLEHVPDVQLITERQAGANVSQAAYDGKLGEHVAMCLGEKSKALLSEDAKSVLGVYPADTSDVWRMFTDLEVLDYLRVVDVREGTKAAALYKSRFEVVEPKLLLTAKDMDRIFVTLTLSDYQAYAPGMTRACREFGITTARRIAHFCGQVGHESAGLRYLEELASGAAYEGRQDLGNTQPGDGVRFKGRGFIQLTGRANYRAAGQALKLPLEANPQMASRPDVAWRIAGWYWKSRNLNHYADMGDGGFDTVTRLVNGGFNGYQDRLAYYGRAKAVLGI